MSNEQVSVDGAPIEAWASLKSVLCMGGNSPPPGDGGDNPTVDCKGETRRHDRPVSTTDPDACLYEKARQGRIAVVLHGPCLDG